MSDILALNQTIGIAYGLRHAEEPRRAVSLLRQAFDEMPEMRRLAEARQRDLAAIVQARSAGGECGCYISKVTHDLLTEALDA